MTKTAAKRATAQKPTKGAKATQARKKIAALTGTGADPECADASLDFAGIKRDLKFVPINQILPPIYNPRSSDGNVFTQDLEPTVLKIGTLQNVILAPSPDQQDRYVLLAGERRWRANLALAQTGKITEDAPIPAMIFHIDPSDARAVLIALTENSVRQQMDEIDEYAAMAELVLKGMPLEEIAAGFGYDTVQVKQRLALGRLPATAHAIIREGLRDMDWAKALTMADSEFQTKICEEVRANPGAWKTGNDIRRFLTLETIPAEHAIFDLSLYRGGIIHNLFAGDSLSDRGEFWNHQNAAVEVLKATLSTEGWTAVTRSDRPVDLWMYDRTEDMSAGEVIIEVSPNGKVIAHKGLVRKQTTTNVEAENDALTHDGAADTQDNIAVDGVRAHGATLAYVNGARGAMVQAAVVGNFRVALEAAIAGMLEAPAIGVAAHSWPYPVPPQLRGGKVFQAVDVTRNELLEFQQEAGRSELPLLGYLTSLTDDRLQRVFTLLVSRAIGPHHGVLDSEADGPINILGQRLAIDIRKEWTPDNAFFKSMRTADLRRLATALAPAARQKGIAKASHENLAALLADMFNDAATGSPTMDAADARKLNAWIPGPMRFPAVDDAALAQSADQGENLGIFENLLGGDTAANDGGTTDGQEDDTESPEEHQAAA